LSHDGIHFLLEGIMGDNVSSVASESTEDRFVAAMRVLAAVGKAPAPVLVFVSRAVAAFAEAACNGHGDQAAEFDINGKDLTHRGCRARLLARIMESD